MKRLILLIFIAAAIIFTSVFFISRSVANAQSDYVLSLIEPADRHAGIDCREWVVMQANEQNGIPFLPDNVGSHWSKHVQVDVVAINWQEKQLLLGECKWGDRAVGKGVLSELTDEKTPKVLKDLNATADEWTIHYMLFARHSFTKAVIEGAKEKQTRLVTLADMV